MGMNKDEIIAYIQRKLGLGIEEVELTPEHLCDIYNDAVRWFAFRLGQKAYIQIPIQRGVSEYKLPDDVIDVLAVRLPSLALESTALGTDDFSYAYSYLFGNWYSNRAGNSENSYSSSPFPYSNLVQQLQYLETIGRIWSADTEFEFIPEQRVLLLMPAPPILGNALVEIHTLKVDPQRFDPQDEDFFLRWALADAKETLGRIRAKYDSYPTVGGDRNMNGDALQQEGKEEKEQLEIQVLARRRTQYIISG